MPAKSTKTVYIRVHNTDAEYEIEVNHDDSHDMIAAKVENFVRSKWTSAEMGFGTIGWGWTFTKLTAYHRICSRVAAHFLRLLDAAWMTEETLNAAMAATPLGAVMPFDRTKHADALIRALFDQAWETGYREIAKEGDPLPKAQQSDRLNVAYRLPSLTGDYNLISQVLPNLVPHTFTIARHRCAQDLAALVAEFDKNDSIPHPTKTKKAKVDAAWPADVQERYAQALGLAKTASTFDKFVMPSWRVTPHGRTPALSDSGGVSNLPAMADPYIHVTVAQTEIPLELEEAYITWGGGAVSPAVVPDPEAPGTFWAMDMPEGREKFVSDSGGTMLGQVMLARGLAYDAWNHWSTRDTVLPFYLIVKLNSIRFIGTRAFLESLEGQYDEFTAPGGPIPGFAWSWHKRAPLEA